MYNISMQQNEACNYVLRKLYYALLHISLSTTYLYMYIEMNGNANYNRVFIRPVVRFENPGGGVVVIWWA